MTTNAYDLTDLPSFEDDTTHNPWRLLAVYATVRAQYPTAARAVQSIYQHGGCLTVTWARGVSPTEEMQRAFAAAWGVIDHGGPRYDDGDHVDHVAAAS